MIELTPIDVMAFKLAELAKQSHERLQQNRPIKKIGAAAVALFVSSTIALASPRSTESPNSITNSAQAIASEIEVLEPTTPPEVSEVVTTPEVVAHIEWPNIEGIEPEVEKNLKAVVLNREGYSSFLSNLNVAYIPYAQQYREFHHQPKFNRELPLPSVHVLNHYTAENYNQVNGESVKGFIDSVAKRYGVLGLDSEEQCCATGLYIDVNSRSYLLTPISNRVKSNPPHDHLAMPVDVEAVNQNSVTTDQYTQLIYANLFLLSASGLKDTVPFEQTVIGHAEDRAQLLNEHSDLRGIYPVKIDFKKPEMTLQRYIMSEFIKANPDIWDIPMPQHLLPLLAK